MITRNSEKSIVSKLSLPVIPLGDKTETPGNRVASDQIGLDFLGVVV